MSTDERRAWPRLHLPVYYRLPSFFDRWLRVHDVSRGGCRLASDRSLPEGTSLALEIRLPEGPPVKARARVVWNAELPGADSPTWELGLEFVGIDGRDYDRLSRYLERGGELDGDPAGAATPTGEPPAGGGDPAW